ncbi:sigma factor-like helix-turn-helix DNA-binding protein [Streptomyces sp. NPDC051555]|uniref:sigma factor-like helix-turn-helix DNA-binding protein n=1 Tax=Streptomyces sp. NPDC051555 TaxID=3365657 RepID=UPI00379FB1FC
MDHQSTYGRSEFAGLPTSRTRSHPEFEAFVAGAAGRLLHVAVLLTAEPEGAAPLARRLLSGALARTFADWRRLRGDDPYAATRAELCAAFARSAWRHHGRPRPDAGVLARLSPQERLVVVLRVYEGVAEEQTAALLGIPADRVRAVCHRAMTALRAAAAAGPPPPGRVA